MKIRKIIASNFEVLECAHAFTDDHVKISGRNRAGKSAIGRAIIWGLTGCNVTGSSQTDHLMLNQQEPTTVKLENYHGNIIERRKTIKATTVKFNGTRTTNKDLNVDKDMLLCTSWPGYIERMKVEKQREMFMAILPEVDRLDLFTARTGMTPEDAELGAGYDPHVTHKQAAKKRLNAEYELKQSENAYSDHVLREREMYRKMQELDESPGAWDTTDEQRLQELLAEGSTLKQRAATWQAWKRAKDEAEAAMEYNKLQDEKDRAALAEIEASGECPTCKTDLTSNSAELVLLSIHGPGTRKQVIKDGPEPEKVDNEKLEDVRAEYAELRDHKLQVEAAGEASKNAAVETHKRSEADVAAAKELCQNAKAVLGKAQIIDDALHPVRGIEADVLSMKLAKLPAWFTEKFELQLQEITKTTLEPMPCFRIRHRLKWPEGTTIPLEHCSEGERIVAGVFLSMLFAELSGQEPGFLWIDNPDLMDAVSYAEAVLFARDRGVQVFEARVSDMDLIVEPVQMGAVAG